MASHQEIEVKLRADPEKMAKVRRSPWWRALGPVRRQSLHSVYFDTSDWQLRDRHISLRTRTDGHAIIQTVKLAEGAASPVSRQEWETIVPDAIPDPSLVIDPSLPQAFRKLTSTDLQAVFDVEIKRETRRLTSDRAEIDVSLDNGAVIAGKDREAVHEIELELVTGEMKDLFAEARRLSDVVEGSLHGRTKSDTGYALNLTDRRHWSRAPKLKLAPGMSTGESFQLIVRNSFVHLTANDDCARLNLHVEGAHQCRVALRRLRSAFKIYKSVVRRKRIEPIADELRWLNAILGTARDLDVLQTDLLEPAIEALGEADELAPLMASLAAKKTVAYQHIGEAMSSARYRHALIDLCALGYDDDLGKSGEGRHGYDQPLGGFAARALSRVHNSLLKRGQGFETMSKSERHEVRIALKRLRYAVDFFGSAFDGEIKIKFVKRLVRLQEDLGRMNDVAVAQTMLTRLIGVSGETSESTAPALSKSQLAFATGSVLGWHRRRAAEIDPQLIKDWHSFARAKPFWPSDESATA
jgi:inorganic triphosphatase YgiF